MSSNDKENGSKARLSDGTGFLKAFRVLLPTGLLLIVIGLIVALAVFGLKISGVGIAAGLATISAMTGTYLGLLCLGLALAFYIIGQFLAHQYAINRKLDRFIDHLDQSQPPEG